MSRSIATITLVAAVILGGAVSVAAWDESNPPIPTPRPERPEDLAERASPAVVPAGRIPTVSDGPRYPILEQIKARAEQAPPE